MGWRIVYIEEADYLSLHLDNLKIHNRKEDAYQTLPIADIHTLIVDNYRTVLSTQLLSKLASANVNVVLCSVDHMPKTLLIPHMGTKTAPFMLRKQLSWEPHVKKTIHQSMVRAKLENQRAMLKSIGASEATLNKLKQFAEEVVPGDKTNREGLGAKVYFRAMFGSDFIRFSEDPINAGLNYGYAILRSQISKTLLAKGLNTALGFFHHGPNNQFNLSDDFIEPLRPLIDHFVYHHLREIKIFKKEHKQALIAQTTKKVRFNNVNQTLFNSINQYVDSIVRFADSGGLKDLTHPIIDFNAL